MPETLPKRLKRLIMTAREQTNEQRSTSAKLARMLLRMVFRGNSMKQSKSNKQKHN